MPTAAELRAYALRRARELGVDPAEIDGIGSRESGGFNPNIRDSPRGAVGPMQLLPTTAREVGVRDIRDPYQNIDGGIRYYRQMREQFGTPELAAAAYNAGPGAVQRHGGVPPFRETQNYVAGFPGPPQRRGRGQPAGLGDGADIFGLDQPQQRANPAPRQQQTAGMGDGADIFGLDQPQTPTPARQQRHPAPSGPQQVVGRPSPRAPASAPAITPAQQAALNTLNANNLVFQGLAAASGARRSQRPPSPSAFAGASASNAPQGVGPNGGWRSYVGRDGRPHQMWVGPGSPALAEARYGASSPYNNDPRLTNVAPAGPASGTGRHLPGEGFGSQMFSNLGVGDELAGGAAYLAQGGRNLYRQATGQPIEVAASDAYHAAANAERAGQQNYAAEHPRANVAAGGAGIVIAGAPRAGAAAMTRPFLGIPGATGRGLQTAANAGLASLPFAFANQPQSNPIERIPGTLANAAIAAAAGGAIHMGGEGLAALSARTRRAPLTPQRQLSEAGVTLTPGQMVGGGAQRFEDALTSTPIAGDAIRARQAEGVESFNRAAWNETLAPLDEVLPDHVGPGRPAINWVRNRISDTYENAFRGVRLRPDAQFASDMVDTFEAIADPRVADDLQTIVSGSMSPRRIRGAIDGQTWKSIDEELGQIIRAQDAAAAQGNVTARYVRDGAVQVQQAWRGILTRQTPATVSEQVNAANAAHANFVRLRDAMDAAPTSARGGVVTPAQLNQSVARNAAGHSFAYGDALMQDLTEAGVQVLPPTVPDSGTAIRSFVQSPVKTLLSTPATVPIALGYSRRGLDVLNHLYRLNSPTARAALYEQLGNVARGVASRPAAAPVVLGSGGSTRRFEDREGARRPPRLATAR